MRHALLLSIAGLLLLMPGHCVDMPSVGSLSPSRGSGATRGAGPERTITIVTDTSFGPSADVYTPCPAHSWVVFGATAEEGPLRVEIVSPIINKINHGLVISVIELLSEREDIGELDYPVSVGVRRTNARLMKTTKLRNVEIFNPTLDFFEPGFDRDRVGRRPSPVIALALQLNGLINMPITKSARDSHSFVENLLLRYEFGPNHPEDVQELLHCGSQPISPNAMARQLGKQWAEAERMERLRLMISRQRGGEAGQALSGWQLGKIAERLPAIAMYHIFYEAPRPQPRTRGSLRQSPLQAVFELHAYTTVDRYRMSGARRILDPNLYRAWVPSTFRHGGSLVSLSRDPRLTSGYFLYSEIGTLPRLLHPTLRTTRPVALPSSTSRPSAPPSDSSSESSSSFEGEAAPRSKPDSWWQRWFCSPRLDTSFPRRSPQLDSTPFWCPTS